MGKRAQKVATDMVIDPEPVYGNANFDKISKYVPFIAASTCSHSPLSSLEWVMCHHSCTCVFLRALHDTHLREDIICI